MLLTTPGNILNKFIVGPKFVTYFNKQTTNYIEQIANWQIARFFLLGEIELDDKENH